MTYTAPRLKTRGGAVPAPAHRLVVYGPVSGTR